MNTLLEELTKLITEYNYWASCNQILPFREELPQNILSLIENHPETIEKYREYFGAGMNYREDSENYPTFDDYLAAEKGKV